MGAPIGNKFAEGNKGGGRKSAYQEIADARLLYEMFMENYNSEEIGKKLQEGKYSLKDKYVQMAHNGNERLLVEVFRKFFPDKAIVDQKGTSNVKLYTFEDSRGAAGDRPVQKAEDTVATEST